ncbi:bifunctional hydroxymethylpyrimidine kinase/phosphomethylpyrimidine kinase [Alkalicoccobacillus murimartini]|uniref:Hydroxymethylpyrimidine/phosphomethylpyrimidine kinase n=1 Tax=Alkalicoccobacillus murimartini TaxID=171685 RepID=A0ABT9YCN4_9BACI|nr:bifunctional hydroxymethylpyrimidine kinase/phosphomethylpyrimidine kinase [Alkalicoccobacillus murimartini]MDQ0205608.1 hydroxymethylpyrimidine/phosphomethylpyrimidine kinase [Alkalicoccobacillus murimartini]
MAVAKVLTIAGSDSGGGAGIQADLKTFQELDTYGMSAITAITAQNTLGVQSIYPVQPEVLREQLESVLSDIGADVVKTGMLVSAEHIQVITEMLSKYAVKQVVIDPVLGSTSGSELTKKEAISELIHTLWPMATVVTPNLIEAARVLSCPPIETVEAMEEATYRLHELGSANVLLKGGHLPGDESVDLLYDGKTLHHFTQKRLNGTSTHGTGCTFASAIAAELAKGSSMYDAVQTAKTFITCSIKEGLAIGEGIGPVFHSAYRRRR